MSKPERPIIDLAGGRKAEVYSDSDDKGKIVARARLVDTIGLLERAGTIEPELRMAADEFRADFHAASLSGVRLSCLDRIDKSTGPFNQSSMERAANAVWGDIIALGGVRSLATNAMWTIVGMENSIREWARLKGMADKRATGVLIAALDIVARRRRILS